MRALAALLLVTACATSTTPEGEADGAPPAGPDARPAADAFRPGDGGGGADLLLYAHTDTTLYRGDPSASPLTLVEIGDFDCIGGSGEPTSMNDLAVDRDGHLFGISRYDVHPLELSGSTVHCLTSWSLPEGASFYGLTFAPAGVLGAAEMLVAANSAGELWAIDSAGTATQVGSFGLVPANDGRGHTYDPDHVGLPWELSGDIVFLDHAGDPVGFATVRDCPNPPSSYNCNPIDTLVEIDVPALALGRTAPVVRSVRGQVVKRSGCVDPGTGEGYGSMYGVAAWNDKVYGFSRAGHLVEISNVDGAACLVASYAPEKFAGAGITTVAPVIID